MVSAYSTFIEGLLDLTDNLSGGNVVHPEGIRVHDDDDPYLVVTAPTRELQRFRTSPTR